MWCFGSNVLCVVLCHCSKEQITDLKLEVEKEKLSASGE